MLQALFIDAAGTLIDTTEPVGVIYARHFRPHGLDLQPHELLTAFKHAFSAAGPPDYAAHDSGHDAERAHWQGLVHAVLLASGPDATTFAHSDAFPASFTNLYNYYADPDAWTVFPDTLPFLERASTLARLAVVSNFDHRLHPILDAHGLTPFFEHIITSGDAKSYKPQPEIFHLALETMQLTPAQAAHVGDCPRADLQGARNAGLHAFHLHRPHLTFPDFLDFCQSKRI